MKEKRHRRRGKNLLYQGVKEKLKEIAEETKFQIMDSKSLQFERLSDNLFSIIDENEIKSYLN